jgi:Tfp pilus assembly protein PilV
MVRNVANTPRDDEAGFGLVEIVVSMVILAALSLAFLPLLIQGIKQSAATATLATASQLVGRQMEAATSISTCSAATSLAGVQSFTDPRSVTIQLTTTVAACPTGTGTVKVTTTATRPDTGATLATGTTLVLIK